MNIADKLQRVPTESDYNDVKKCILDDMHCYYKSHPASIAVASTYYYDYEFDMNKNGMEKLIVVVVGLIFQIEHNDVDPEIAYGAAYDIRDFDTGEYDDLFTAEDLKLLKADIEKCREYLKKHPEITDDLSEHFK